jgi:hypothetical protein
MPTAWHTPAADISKENPFVPFKMIKVLFESVTTRNYNKYILSTNNSETKTGGGAPCLCATHIFLLQIGS